MTSNITRSGSYLNPLLLKTFCKHFHVFGVLWTSILSTAESAAGFHKTPYVLCCVGITVVTDVITKKTVINSNTHHRTWRFSPLQMIRAMLDCSRMNEQHCLLVRCTFVMLWLIWQRVVGFDLYIPDSVVKHSWIGARQWDSLHILYIIHVNTATEIVKNLLCEDET